MNASTAQLPGPKSYLDTAITFGVLGVLPFAAFSTWQMSRLVRWPLSETLPFGLAAGLGFGLLFGLLAGFMLKDIVVSVDLADPRNFTSHLAAAMSRTGFKLKSLNNDSFIYKPTLRCGIATGKIWGQWNNDQAVIVGPRWYFKKLLLQLASEEKKSLRNL